MQAARRVRPARNLTLRQRRFHRRAWGVNADDATILPLGHRCTGPNLLAVTSSCRRMILRRQAAVVASGLSALVEILMNHLL